MAGVQVAWKQEMLLVPPLSVIDSLRAAGPMYFKRKICEQLTSTMQFNMTRVFTIPRHQISIIWSAPHVKTVRMVTDYKVLVTLPVFGDSLDDSKTYIAVAFLCSVQAVGHRSEHTVAVTSDRNNPSSAWHHEFLFSCLHSCSFIDVYTIYLSLSQH